MKRIFLLLFCVSVTFFWGACNSNNPQTDITSSDEESNENATETEVTNEDILIIYFSRAGENWNVGYVERGNTAVMADYIQEFTGGATFEIVPEIPYPDDYATMLQVSQKERDTNTRPTIKNPLENLDKYSVVFIGSPIWYGGPPMIMHTFYETYPTLATKTIVPFGTHGGSGISSCVSLIRQYFPNAELLESYGVSGERIRNSKDDVINWLRRIGFGD